MRVDPSYCAESLGASWHFWRKRRCLCWCDRWRDAIEQGVKSRCSVLELRRRTDATRTTLPDSKSQEGRANAMRERDAAFSEIANVAPVRTLFLA